MDGIDFELEEGEVRGLIGPNDSGKSTFFNLVSGIYRPDEGSRIRIGRQETTHFEPHRIAALGVARTFQLLRVFSEITVLEILLVGHHLHVAYGPLAAARGVTGAGIIALGEDQETVYRLDGAVETELKANRKAGT